MKARVITRPLPTQDNTIQKTTDVFTTGPIRNYISGLECSSGTRPCGHCDQHILEHLSSASLIVISRRKFGVPFPILSVSRTLCLRRKVAETSRSAASNECRGQNVWSFTSTSSFHYDVVLRHRDKLKSCEHDILTAN